MSSSCPISNRRIDSHLVRLISLQVLVWSLFFIVTQSLFFTLVILFDFTVRLVRKESYSPFTQVGKFILKQWSALPRYTDESPKRFALYLGFVMGVITPLFALFGWSPAAVAVASVLMICAFIEVLFDFCIGCKIYYAIQLFKVIKYDRNFH